MYRFGELFIGQNNVNVEYKKDSGNCRNIYLKERYLYMHSNNVPKHLHYVHLIEIFKQLLFINGGYC